MQQAIGDDKRTGIDKWVPRDPVLLLKLHQ